MITIEYLTESETAARLRGVAPATLRAWRARGYGPAYHRRGRRIVYRADDVDAWAATQRVEPTTTTEGDDR